MNTFVASTAIVGALLCLASVRLQLVATGRSNLVAFNLRFARGQPSEAVQRFLAGWSGSLPPAWKRWAVGVPALTLETRAHPQAITHHLIVSERWAAMVEALFSAHLPNVRYEREPIVELGLTSATEYRASTSKRTLAVDSAAVSSGALSALLPLGPDERAVVQYVLGPHAPVLPPRTNGNGKPWWVNNPTYVDSSEAATALRKKQSAALLLGVGRIGVRTKSAERGHQLLRRIEAPWHSTRAPGVHLRRRLLPKWFIARRINQRVIPAFEWPGGAINIEEASGLIAWPIEIDQLPGLTLGGCRLLPVPQAVPSAGTIIGSGTFPSTKRPVALDANARTRHLLVSGPTGTGKTIFLSRLALSDLSDGNGPSVIIDPKDGGLIDRIVESMPSSRLDDVIVFDPTSPRAVGFDPIACTADTRELVVDQVVSIMAAVWKANWGPRSSDLVRHALLTLTQVPGMTMVEAPRLLTDPAFRRSILARLDDPMAVGGFWSWFDALSAAEQASIVAAPTNKLRSLTSRTAVRHEIGHPNPAIDFKRVLSGRSVLLVRLSSGLLGDETASLLGAFVTAQLWQAIAARAAVPAVDRQLATVIIDELQTVLRFPINTIEDMFTQARGYGVSVSAAHQHLQGLPKDVREAALANTRSKLVFACSQRDAAIFARELGTGLTADDLREIEAHEAVAAIFAAGRTQPATTISVLPPAEQLRSADEVYSLARQRHGTERADIEAAIRDRQVVPANANVPVGRRRRGSS